MRHLRTLSLVLTLALLIACRVERAPEQRAGVAASQQGVQSAAARAISERPMAHRREGQGLLDSARTALTGGERAPAAALLHRAAAFFVRQANDPPSGGTADLLAAARGLDSLAMDVSLGRTADASRLDRLSAHANLAEAERHGALAAVAWSTRSKESVSDELVMAADHVERATLDANLTSSPVMRRLVAELRAVARDLSSQQGLDLRDLDEPLSSLHIEIGALHRRLEGAARNKM